MTDHTINTSGGQLMSGLDGDQSAEPAAEHKNRPDPQRAARGEEDHAKPANGVAVEGPEPVPVGVGGQVMRSAAQSVRKAISTHRLARSSRSPVLRFPPLKSATAAIKNTATARAIRAGWKKLGKPSPAENSEPNLSNGPDCGDERQRLSWPHRSDELLLIDPLSRFLFG
jgi:hypothetical protein